MRVIVFAQDRSGRRDDGYYSKPDISSALDIFFKAGVDMNTLDLDGEHPLDREAAESIFNDDRRVAFYNEDGEQVIISADPSV